MGLILDRTILIAAGKQRFNLAVARRHAAVWARLEAAGI